MPEENITTDEKENKENKVKDKKEKDPINLFYMAKKIFPMVFKAKPSYCLVNQSLSIIHGMSHGANVMVAQIFFDSVYRASTGDNTVTNVIIALIFFIACRLASDILNAVHNFTTNVHWHRAMGFMNSEINKKSALIDPVEYENPKRLDDINKAANGAGSAVHLVFILSTVITFYLPYFIFMGFYLTSLKPMLILCLLFVFIPVLTAQILRSSVFSKLEDKAAPIRREFDAYQDATAGKNFYKETRNLGSFKYLKNLLIDTINSLNSAVWSANKRSSLIDFGFNTLSLLGYGGILFLLVKYLLAGEISVGAFAAVYNSIGMLFGVMNEMISGHLGHLANNFGQIRNFLRFLDIPSDARSDLAISKKDGVIIENASFKYPNAEKESLKNINLVINPGETIAIVGENGAGKTTLVKLLTGLYKPTEGSVKIGETDVNTISYKSLFESVSGVFQNYQRYALTLKENIQIADFSTEENTGSQTKVDKILEENNIDKNNTDIFPNSLDTMLSREFDGVDLSGGQWQRIAIARGFYRDSDIIVLDEPTASIDPIEESAIYKKFVEIAKAKTAVIVTHRMGSAKIAERIVVMKDGEIAEIGSHDELVQKGGAYADMYDAQAGWYN
ncbi:MAG: ABC transporter ATP-binding protein/permease [Oscillospiraceae bacterium]|nr:ABC transporter ATP-binding protein/permease [Oscillospiraceae bacterium]